jgi:hypothetical protein
MMIDANQRPRGSYSLEGQLVGFLQDIWWTQSNYGYGFICVKEGQFWRDIPVEVPRGGEIKLPKVPKGADIYFTPNLFSERERRKEYMLDSCWLYADLDKVDPFEVETGYRPTIAWQSSPRRYQALWELPTPLTPESHAVLNKRLTYYLGADRSGWDATQLLRVPGTKNYKYDPPPKVKLLWDDGRVVRDWRKVKETKPKAPKRLAVVKVDGNGLPASVRAKLAAKVATGDRSKVLWRLEKQLLEAGYTKEEVFTLLKPTVWNKFPTDERLFAEIERAALRVVA